jgi:hypothetical protein
MILRIWIHNTEYSYLLSSYGYRCSVDGFFKIESGLNETVSRDFRLLVFFINQLPLGPWLTP